METRKMENQRGTIMKNINSPLLGLCAGCLMAVWADGATVNWNVASGSFDTAGNWNPTAVFSDSNADSYFMSNGGDATLANTLLLGASSVSVGQNDGATASTLTVQNGGDLSANDFRVAVGSGQSGTSQVTIENGGVISTSNSQIGQQSTGILNINFGGTFSHSGDLRLGNTSTANGTIINSGTYSSPNAVILSENTGTSKFTVSGGSTTARVFDMDNGGSATLELNGSSGGFTLTGTGTALSAASATSTLNFVFDSSGVAFLTLSGASATADISNANLSLNPGVAAPGTYTLIDNTNGGSITGLGSASISIFGGRSGTVFEQSGDLLVTLGAVVPEPGSFTLLLGGMAYILAKRRSKKVHS